MEETTEKITYESLWKAIIRPPRDYFREEDLGATIFNFSGRSYIRKDFEIIDFRGKILKVSFIEPELKDRPCDIMPCVIYVHANASSRLEGINMKRYLLKNYINICAFDFEGSGYSEGEYISLGYHEKNQLRNIVDFVEKYPGVGDIGLWGRSMGAATTLIYASMDKRIKAIVVDSPFSDFRKVAKETVLNQVHVPGFLVEGAISIIGKSVFKKNGMKINDIKAIDAVKKCKIPVIFIHARDDDIVKFQHSLDLFNNYAGNEKELKEVVGGHNGRRTPVILESVGRFFARHLINENENDINNIFSNTYENNHEINEDPSKNENTYENYNFDLNQRKRKTIYEEWGIGHNNLNTGVNNRKEYNSFSFKATNKIDSLKKGNKKTEGKNSGDKKEDKKIEDKSSEDKKEDNKNKNENNKNLDSNKIKTKIILDNNIIKDINNISKEETNSKIDMSTNTNTNANSNNKKISNKDNNIDSSLDQPKIKRKTIYDDLNIRP